MPSIRTNPIMTMTTIMLMKPNLIPMQAMITVKAITPRLR